MSKTPLSPLTKGPLHIPMSDKSWPIPDQFVGLEIEVENYSGRQANELLSKPEEFWDQKEDGSLRQGCEFVLRQPLMGRQLALSIEQFFSTMTTYTTGPRTSIHVHMNMRQNSDTLESLRNLCTLYYMYENAFFAIADEARKWCAYCNQFEDVPPEPLIAIFRGGNLDDVIRAISRSNRNTARYYGLNLYALQRYGTLEFRHFPCVKDRKPLLDWLTLLMELKQAATVMADSGLTPQDVFTDELQMKAIEEMMPRFGKQLRGLVDDETAFSRMCTVSMYRAGVTAPSGGGVETSKVFERFLEKKKLEKKPKKTRDPFTELLQREIAGTREMMTRGMQRPRATLRGDEVPTIQDEQPAAEVTVVANGTIPNTVVAPPGWSLAAVNRANEVIAAWNSPVNLGDEDSDWLRRRLIELGVAVDYLTTWLPGEARATLPRFVRF